MPVAPEQLDQKRTELILQQLEQLPTLPAVAMQVLEVTGNDQSSARDVVKLIESDVSLTARILHLVHRPDMGVRGEVNTVERAVVLLGFAAVRSAVLAVSVFETFGTGPARKFGHFARDDFWKHSIAVACCAELLAEKLGAIFGKNNGIEPSQAFVAGLLHDLGKVALDACLPKSFDRVVEAVEMLRGNIADVERKVIGLDHMVVGKRLAERWQLPAVMRDAIWLHGQLPQALPATVKMPRLVNLITLADQLVREQHIGYSGNYTYTVPRQSLLDSVGLSDEHVKETLLGLVARIEPRAAALGLNRASSNELYQQALSRANKELGRVTEQLATKNRRLAIRAKFFDALSGFQSELRPDAPPQTVLQAVGQTAVGVLDVKALCAFSLPPGQPFAEALLFDEHGNVFENTLVDCSARPGKPDGGDGPVLACGDDMEWIVSAISPRLAHDQRYWICLEADGQCIGGIVWGAPTGESQRLSSQVQELTAIASGWSLALRTAQIREEARTLAEQLAEVNRQLHNAQNEILRSKMLISIGEMAAGAAHEMNNPLAVISGRSQLLASALSEEKLKASAKQIYDQTHRLSDIITELMHYAKPVPPKPDANDLADLIDRALHDARQQADVAGRAIEVTLADVPPVNVDGEQVRGAFVEIFTNAVLASDPQKGHIEVHAAFDPYSARVAVTITDNGCGMDERTLKHAFDPFFSNLKAGRRRGMGLAKALRWVESSGGSIRLESRVDHGTRVIVLLPAAAPEAAETPVIERKTAT
jgi:putative nucleotidyltransferase with HDIG domain